ncbi:porin family protein [Seonamhaeicola sp. ML3]|uniref:porin family protein n=1 Tax=Seonamhaeicola sp. ML3 TaxID=2937786 RepID=UPI00200ED6F7|nr:porin family protein [Seonamhaeicola sp. ML3]
MKQILLILWFLFLPCVVCAQDNTNVKALDSLYKEDQFYLGVTYNLFGEKPTEVSQSGFSLGFQLGFIKDMPINKGRNLALALGLGYSTNSFNQNILIDRVSTGTLSFSVLDANSFSKNKFSSHYAEVPFEFRWRTSTAADYNFWRIYAGMKLGYLIANTAKYQGVLGNRKLSDLEDFNKFQYGLTLSAGYATWNLYFYYGLSPIFTEDATLNNESLDIRTLKIGLIFYFL